MTPPGHYRCESDRSLAEELSNHDSVRPLMRMFHEREQSSQGTRRSLLAQALRLTPSISPSLHTILDRCRELLSVEAEVELYVYSSPQFNAACTAPEGDRVFVLLSSSLAEAFAEDELAFVVGHEHGRVPASINVDALLEALTERVARCNELVRPSRRAQVLRDLAAIARADGHVDEAERALLFDLSRQMHVDVGIVRQALDAPIALD